jgi:hypothetical protein
MVCCDELKTALIVGSVCKVRVRLGWVGLGWVGLVLKTNTYRFL